MDIEDLYRRFDVSQRDKILLECIIVLLSQTRVMSQMLAEFLAGGDIETMNKLIESINKRVDVDRDSVIKHLFAMFGATPDLSEDDAG